jgi:hypothetical protein
VGVGVRELKDGKILSPGINMKKDPGKTVEKARKGEFGTMPELPAIQEEVWTDTWIVLIPIKG